MSLYYFHIRNSGTLFEDRRGGEFPDLQGAWAWALNDARQLVEDDALPGAIEDHWTDVCNRDGTTVATLPFGRVHLH